ncbi:hypothetical protein LCGC14_3006640 [marine sediment metagenome]|uniref:Uncharacterized protein n=1 Tax=marine sediment metagenome TaxID=412755 RepID=A0A0F8Z724_9ZZZZ
MWWETVPGLITLWATATAGVVYLVRQAWRATKFGRKVTGALRRLILIGTTDQWPNGAEDLPAAMNEIYIKQSKTHTLLESYIVAHRADHGFPPPEGTPDGF